MAEYLLLRSNKETGPYSLEQLAGMGLKPYDLIWVKGKSAAWRYPGEIDELKSFAPPVEEQPYDRFYKKKSEEQKIEEVSPYQPQPAKVSRPVEEIKSEKPVEEMKHVEEIKQVEEKTTVEEVKNIPEPELPAPKTSPSFTPPKKVFVTLPKKPAATPQPQARQEEPVPVPIPEPVTIKDTPQILIKETPVTAEIKYSQPLDEIKEMYVKNLQERKEKKARKTMLIGFVKKAAVIVAIVGIGVVIGLSFRSKNDLTLASLPGSNQPVTNITGSEQANEGAEPVIDQNNETVNDEPVTTLSAERQDKAPLFRENEQAVTRDVRERNDDPVVEAEKPVVKKQQPAVIYSEPEEAVEVNTRTGERTGKKRNNEDLPVSNEEARESKPVAKPSGLTKYVSVKSNNYQVVAFGGIRNLHLTVYNDSKVTLDNVMVELQYIKPSEQPLRTENIEFRSISPGGSQTIRIPDTNRGIRVDYRIISINPGDVSMND